MKRSALALLILLLAVPAGAAQTRLRGFWPALGDYVSGSGVVAGDLDMDTGGYSIILDDGATGAGNLAMHFGADTDLGWRRVGPNHFAIEGGLQLYLTLGLIEQATDSAVVGSVIKGTNAYSRAITYLSGGPLFLGGGVGSGRILCDFDDAPGTILEFIACDATGCTVTTLTEGIDWNRDTDDALTCAALMAHINGLGLRFTATCDAYILWVDHAATMTSFTMTSADGVGGGQKFLAIDGEDGPVTLAENIKTRIASDWDLVDDNASALSFDVPGGVAGILEIDTTSGVETVKMSMYLNVARVATLQKGFIITTGDITTSTRLLDWDLIDDSSFAITFDAPGKTRILQIDTTDGAEGVKMSGYLDVAGMLHLGGGGAAATYPALLRSATYVYFKLGDNSDYASLRAEEVWAQSAVILVDAGGSFSVTGKSKWASSANGIMERTINDGTQGLREDLTVNGTVTYTDEVGGPLSVVHTGTLTHNETVTSDAKVTTTDALDNLIASITLADGEVLVVEATILGRERDGSDRNMYHVSGLFYRQGGAAVQEGVSTYIVEVESDVAWCGDLAVSGNDVQITVDGNGDTVDWEVTYTYQILVSAA